MSASADMRGALIAAGLLACAASPAAALDLNALRAEHRLPPLSYNATLAGAAHEHARDMARRKQLDHKNFKACMAGVVSGVAAENVLFMTCARPDAKPVTTFAGRACGCADQSCAIAQWARSAGHRRNMLMKGVSAYGIASALSEDGRRYWVIVLGN
jgi:uncharacterized protein YkwD